MSYKVRIVWVAMLLVASASTAQQVEITPFGGFQFGGWFSDRFHDDDDFDDIDVEESESYGLIVDLAINRHAQIELLYSLQETELETPRFFGSNTFDLDLEYFHVGFLWQWLPSEKLRPFVVGSLGVASFDLERGDDESRFSTSVGGGVKLLFNEHFGIRFEGRTYASLIDQDEELFCNPDFCFEYRDTTFFVQSGLKVGLVFAF